MNPRCAVAITQAALTYGKNITQRELANIEQRINGEVGRMMREAPDRVRKMTAEERMIEAGANIGNQLRADAIKTARNKEKSVTAAFLAKTENNKLVEMGTKSHTVAMINQLLYDGGGNYNLGVTSRHNFISHDFMSGLRALNEFTTGTMGLFGDKKMSDLITRELKGVKTGNADAAAVAKDVRELLDRVRREELEAGGKGGYLEGWVPQQMSSARVGGSSWDFSTFPPRKRSLQERQKVWVDDAMKHIDRTKILDSNGNMKDDAGARKFLEEAWMTVYTDGYIPPETRSSFAVGDIAARNSQARHLHWKDADSHIAMMEKYGDGSLFEQLKKAVDSSAMNIALMKKFGPNAIHNLRELRDSALRADKEKMLFDPNDARLLDAAIDRITGLDSGVSGNVDVHNFFKNIKTLNSVNSLGTMVISQMSDNMTSIATARAMNAGAGAWGLHKLDFYKNKDMRDFGKATGIAFDVVTDVVSRMSDSASNAGLLSDSLNLLMKVQLAPQLTALHRNAFSTFMLSHTSSLVKKKNWNDLGVDDRNVMEMHGLGELDWKILGQAEGNKLAKGTIGANEIRSIPLEKIRELIPEKVEQIKQTASQEFGKNIDAAIEARINKAAETVREEALTKYIAMAIDEAEMAVLQPSMKTDLRMFGMKANGTWAGELGSAVLQFKKFPMAMFFQHVVERANAQPGKMGALKYRAMLAGLGTLFGGMSLMMYDLATGRDPREVYDPENPKSLLKFSTQAMMKGGGMGILADFAGAFMDRSPVESLSGPTMGKAVGIGHVASEAMKAIQGEDNKLAYQTLRTAKAFTPFQNLLWTRAVVDNLIVSELYELANPGYQSRMRNLAEKNYSSDYYLGMGNELRAPNFDNITTQ